MIFNRDVLFLHIPKTGGMSVTEYLCEVLPPPVYNVQPAQAKTFGRCESVPGRRHATVSEAAAVVEEHGLSLAGFRAILAIVRNPYDLEVSRFAYLQKGHPWDRGYNADLAMAGDFEAFAAQSRYHRPGVAYEDYILVDGEPPANLQVLRFESLADDLERSLSELGLDPEVSLPRRNRSDHDHFEAYYTPAAERAVYQKYRWVFDQGYYERMTVPV